MSRKVYVEVTTRLIINADDNVDIDEVIQEMEYDFISQTEGADIEDTEITSYDTTDSK
jgi:hypothetical protein